MAWVQELRDWMKREPVTPESHRLMSDSLKCRAILELADGLALLEGGVRELTRRVEAKERYPVTGTYKGQIDDFHIIEQKLQASNQPDATESPPEPFRVTGPGNYRRRNGNIGKIIEQSPSDIMPALYRWKDETGRSYRDEGQFYVGSEDYRDFVEGPLPDEGETAGLYGFTAYELAQGAPLAREVLYPNAEQAFAHASAGGSPAFVIDLSKVPQSAIVKPAPKIETRITGWQNLFRGNSCVQGAIVYKTKEQAEAAPGAVRRVACVFIDVPNRDATCPRVVALCGYAVKTKGKGK